MHRALDSRDDIYRLYISRKEGGGGLTNIKNSVDPSVRVPEEYIKKSKEKIIAASSSSIDNVRSIRKRKTKKQKWEEKQMYAYFNQ